MEFNEKLQILRKQKELTQEELASALFVSRTAISKWESGRGYPSIDSLKSIADFFKITVDELLSGDELLNIAEQDAKQKKNHFCDLLYGLLDICASLLLFLPFFAQKVNNVINEVSLINLNSISPWLKIIYFVIISLIVITGILTLAMQNLKQNFWLKFKNKISLVLNMLAVLIFISSLQPYAAVFVFMFLIIKVIAGR